MEIEPTTWKDTNKPNYHNILWLKSIQEKVPKVSERQMNIDEKGMAKIRIRNQVQR